MPGWPFIYFSRAGCQARARAQAAQQPPGQADQTRVTELDLPP